MPGHWGGTSYSIPNDLRQEQRGPQVRHTLVEQGPIHASETSPPRKDLQGEAGGRSTVADWATRWAGQRKGSVTGGGGGRSGRAGLESLHFATSQPTAI